MLSRTALATLALATLALGACHRPDRHHPPALEPCQVEGLTGEARCASYPVWEDREAGAGRRIELEVVVLPALGQDRAPDPVFYFSGGPGTGVTEMVGGGGQFADLRQHRDVVLVDQRGTGSSHPLDCAAPEDLAGYFRELFPADLVRACREELEQKADLALYTTAIAMDDVDEVRAWLGYERINLVGGSYGTRAAQVYLRRHPEHVRSAVLLGVVASDQHLPLYHAPDAQRSLALVLEACAQEAACAAAFPDPGGDLEAVLGRLDQGPVEVAVPHPETGQPITVPLDRDAFVTDLRFLLYSPATAVELPLLVHLAAGGDLAPLVLTGLPFRRLVTTRLSLGMHLSVTCAEDIPFIDRELAASLYQGTFLGDSRVRQQTAACEQWVRGEIPAGFHEPVRSAAPTLLVSGALDPVTPPRWAEATAAHLANGRHLVVEHGHHSMGGLANGDCLTDLVTAFIERGSAEGLDASCLATLRRPPFVTDPEKLAYRGRVGTAAGGDGPF